MDATLGQSGFPGAWYAAFYDGERPGWWRWFCRPGFGHVAAFGWCVHAERWLIYDVTLGRTYVRALTREAFAAWLDALPAHRTILHFEAPDGDAPCGNPGFRLGFWCTPAVAHLLGAPSRALRPEGLYRDLIAYGARRAFEPEQSG